MLTIERLDELLRYAPDEGAFYWRNRTGRARAGDRAGTQRKDGYRLIRIDGRRYLEHRLVWFKEHGGWPEDQIDHKNRVRNFNRVENLRPASPAIQRQNMKRRTDNTTGHTGVHGKGNRWRAVIGIEGRQKFLGTFATKEDAIAARKAAEATYHPHKPDDE